MRFPFSKGFLKLLTRYRNNQSTSEEKEVLDTWYESLDDPDADTARDRKSREQVWMKIMDRTSPAAANGGRQAKSSRRFLYYAAAAVVVLASSLIGYFAYRGDLPTSPIMNNAISTILENDTDKPSKVGLPDGSTVILEPAARLSYTSHFNKQTRTVQLEGNAFFSIAKNKKVPFIVKTQTIETKVLGTEFSIRKNVATGETEVEVITGKVEVNVIGNASGAQERKHVFLTANLKATFQPENKELVMSLIDLPQMVDKQEAMPEQFIFKERPLRHVIDRLETAYGVSIKVANSEMLNCPITANLSNEPLSTQLAIVVTALNAEFTVAENGIQINGGGCVPSIKNSR
ncbi:FecR family protein [Dyadobacter sp. 32]|uniref:FecR family protein n=1 Tax=Dyadobacter sp. 32 TaxID=538966 RepID=UPI0011ED1103